MNNRVFRQYSEQEKKQIAEEIAKAIPNATKETINNLDASDETLLHKAIIVGNNIHVGTCITRGAKVYQRDVDLASQTNLYQISQLLSKQTALTDHDWNAKVIAAQNARVQLTKNNSTQFSSSKGNDQNDPNGSNSATNTFANKPFVS